MNLLTEYSLKQVVREQEDELRSCKICGLESARFDVLDFEKFVSNEPYSRGLSAIPVVYRRCTSCGFIFTNFFDDFSEQQWQENLYNSEYFKVDHEYAEIRPSYDSAVVSAYLGDLKSSMIGLDFGGGKGRTAELLREKGWAFDCYDPFGRDEVKEERLRNYNLCTAFEVLEHLPDPIGSMQQVLDRATTGPLLMIVGTALSDRMVSETSRLSWSYAGPRNGHISLFSQKSLARLAMNHGLDLTTSSQNIHFLSRGYDLRGLSRRMTTGRLKMAWLRRFKRTV